MINRNFQLRYTQIVYCTLWEECKQTQCSHKGLQLWCDITVQQKTSYYQELERIILIFGILVIMINQSKESYDTKIKSFWRPIQHKSRSTHLKKQTFSQFQSFIFTLELINQQANNLSVKIVNNEFTNQPINCQLQIFLQFSIFLFNF